MHIETCKTYVKGFYQGKGDTGGALIDQAFALVDKDPKTVLAALNIKLRDDLVNGKFDMASLAFGILTGMQIAVASDDPVVQKAIREGAEEHRAAQAKTQPELKVEVRAV
jgi:hypothetical protein